MEPRLSIMTNNFRAGHLIVTGASMGQWPRGGLRGA
jgi:hypothetical protein